MKSVDLRTHTINQFVEFNPFYKIPNTQKLNFYVFDFHPFFDGLIGYEALQHLKANIITTTNELQLPYGTIQMLRKYPCSTKLQLNSNETKILHCPVTIENGDFFVPYDTKLSDFIFIQSGLYNAKNNYAYLAISNCLNEPTEVEIFNPIDSELNNFEVEMLPQPARPINRQLYNQLRIDHLNLEEKTKLLKIITEHQDVFLLNGENLTFSNAIKHSIKTKDDMRIYCKSYRYPFCHREEVQRQIAQMLEQGIIRHSISPWTSPVWIVPKKMDASGEKKWRLVIDYRNASREDPPILEPEQPAYNRRRGVKAKTKQWFEKVKVSTDRIQTYEN